MYELSCRPEWPGSYVFTGLAAGSFASYILIIIDLKDAIYTSHHHYVFRPHTSPLIPR